MSAPEEITRTAFEETGTRYWVLPDFLEQIQDAVASIPEDKRGEALVSFEGDYDEWGYLRITYEDVETDAEVAARLEEQARYEREAETRERAQFEQLAKKFGGAA